MRKNDVTAPKRIASWWVRWEDLNFYGPDGMDRIKARAEAMAEGNATTAMIFGTHFRWDYLPYFTLVHDYLATVAEELHKRGLELYDHHSVNLIHRYDTRDELRHVMLHSGPHLPFSPSREAAANWEYNGSRLNDWRMVDVRTGKPLYYPQYASEGFCYRNPDFVEAYCSYLKRLVADTGIDGLSADDPVHYMHYISCACPHCRAELKRRAGVELPPVTDRGFWGNWENPAWHHWVDLRYDAAKGFFEKVSACLPEGFRLTTCGSSSASYGATGKGSDAQVFLAGGCNFVNLEMSGNTPPYKHDPVTANDSILNKMANASHHQAAAREKGVRCFGTGYAFTKPSANIIWAVNKMLGADCWFSTLKDRLGLPDHILKELPDEPAVICDAFGFEKKHPELFAGEQIGQLAVFYSPKTRDHTCLGNMAKGYYHDYKSTMQKLFQNGMSAHTVFKIPADPAEYPLLLVPSAAAMTEAEADALRAYVKQGGKAVVTGPTPMPECQNSWQLPTAPEIENPDDFFSTIANGVWHKNADWIMKTEIPPSGDPDVWQQPVEGLYYNPRRASEDTISHTVMAFCRQFARPLPVKMLENTGYLVTMFKHDGGITVHLLAEDYDTDIDHHLDEIRFHRSRVNYINKVEPVGITDRVVLEADVAPTVYTPFSEIPVEVTCEKGTYTVRLPEKTAYAVLHFC